MLVRTLYTLVLFLTSPILLYGLYKSKPNKPKFGARWKEHFGITPKLNTRTKPLWIHAVSVGECIAATPLIKELKARNPEQIIVVTTTTSTGAEQIEKLGNLVVHRYMPIDFVFAVKGYIKATNPESMLIIETELWPNTLYAVHQAGIPITVINARLSEKSRANYAKIQPLFNQINLTLNKVLCQTKADVERFEQLGFDTSKLAVTGSIKFDITISDTTRKGGQELRKLLGEARPVWIAASTHQGEEDKLLTIHNQVLATLPDALLILVPRHPERFDHVNQLCIDLGLNVIRRTNSSIVSTTPTSLAEVYLGDTMGEMLTLMAASDVCFMGGSLLGTKVGGHNILEPAALGVPVITGPSYYNFKEIVDLMSANQGIKVSTQAELSTVLISLLSCPESRENLSGHATSIVNRNLGALCKTIDKIQEN